MWMISGIPRGGGKKSPVEAIFMNVKSLNHRGHRGAQRKLYLLKPTELLIKQNSVYLCALCGSNF